MNRTFRAAFACALFLSPAAAHAHATLQIREASPDAGYRGVVQITHGCEGTPTNRVSVTIPEGVIGAKPMPKPGWTVTTQRGPYARAYPYYHGDIAEGVKTITWSGGSLPDDQVDEFTFLARISDAFAPGATIHFPVEQDCEKGAYRWSEIPAAGQDPHSLKSPAPGVTLVAAPAKPPAPAANRAGDLAIDTPWMRATPGGAKVAGGYVRITNRGAQADRLVGASFAGSGKASIHSMTMDGGVMKMAAVEGGLVIGPGETVDLKPGGFHIMFEELTAAPKVGQSIPGTLVFERAGTVPVVFAVAPIGARSPNVAAPEAPAAHHHH